MVAHGLARAPPAEDEEPRTGLRDAVVRPPAFEELDEVAVQGLAALVVEGLRERSRRPVRRRKQLPHLLAGRGAQDGVALLELEVEGAAEQPLDVLAPT